MTREEAIEVLLRCNSETMEEYRARIKPLLDELARMSQPAYDMAKLVEECEK